MHGLVAAADGAGFEVVGLAVGAGHEAAGLANQERARRDIPGIQAPLPERVEAAGGDISEIERGAAHPPHIDDSRHHGRELRLESRMLGRLAEMGNAAAEERLRQFGARGHAQAAIAAERPLPFFCDEHVVVRRIVDDAGYDLPLTLERNRNGEKRDRVQEVGCRIERIDMPSVTLVGAFDAPALLHHEAVAWARLGEVRV